MIIEQTAFIPQTNKVVMKTNIDSETLKKEGETIHFDQNGNVIAKLNYKNDVLDGMSYVYTKNKVEYQYHNNGKPAHTRIYNYDPINKVKKNIVDELFYENGILVRVLKYNENGSVDTETTYSEKGCVVFNKIENTKTYYDSINEYIQKYNNQNEVILRIIQTRKRDNIDTLYYESLETQTIISDHYQINQFVKGDEYTVTVDNNVFVVGDFDNYKIKSFTMSDKPNRIVSAVFMNDEIVLISMTNKMQNGDYIVDYKNNKAHKVTINIFNKQKKFIYGELNFFSKIALWLKGVPINAIIQDITNNINDLDREKLREKSEKNIELFKVRLGIINNLFQ